MFDEHFDVNRFVRPLESLRHLSHGSSLPSYPPSSLSLRRDRDPLGSRTMCSFTAPHVPASKTPSLPRGTMEFFDRSSPTYDSRGRCGRSPTSGCDPSARNVSNRCSVGNPKHHTRSPGTRVDHRGDSPVYAPTSGFRPPSEPAVLSDAISATIRHGGGARTLCRPDRVNTSRRPPDEPCMKPGD